MGRRIPLSLLASSLLLLGCRQGAPAPGADGGGSARSAGLTFTRSRAHPALALKALASPHEALRRALGPHRLVASAHTETAVPGHPSRAMTVELALVVDAAGGYRAVKTLGPQQGREVIWAGGRLFSRLRYSRFVPRRASPAEARTIREAMAGLVPAYVGLLGRFMDLRVGGDRRVAGRSAVAVTLGLRKRPLPPPAEAGKARAWRRTVRVHALTGRAVLDARSGVPLRVDLDARWSFVPPGGEPGVSGIPAPDRRGPRGVTTLTLRQRVDRIGAVAPVGAPPAEEVLARPRRQRREVERQMVTGERSLIPGWREVSAGGAPPPVERTHR